MEIFLDSESKHKPVDVGSSKGGALLLEAYYALMVSNQTNSFNHLCMLLGKSPYKN